MGFLILIMKIKNYIIPIILILLFNGCERELDINDFADDFANYEQEIRIEAVRKVWEVDGVREVINEIEIGSKTTIKEYENDFCLPHQLYFSLFFSSL